MEKKAIITGASRFAGTFINSLPDHDFVDLGLPSRVVWAKTNIDVQNPNGFASSPFTLECSFFSWGNVDGYNPENYSFWGIHDWGLVNNGEPWYLNTKYGDTQGSVLNENIPTSDVFDAARAILGGLWKIPSQENFEELFEYCFFIDAEGNPIPQSQANKLVSVENCTGIYLQSSINGERIFFSASGRGGNNEYWTNRGTRGSYWASTIADQPFAKCLYFYNRFVIPNYEDYKHYGFPIRAIKII